jgi:hypothetical protein
MLISLVFLSKPFDNVHLEKGTKQQRPRFGKNTKNTSAATKKARQRLHS